MNAEQTIQIPVGKLSSQMCAVLRIVTAEQVLADAAFRFINLQDNSVDWDAVLKLDLDTGRRAAIQIAYSLWADEAKPGSKLFEDALIMTPDLKRACLKAIGIRWEI